MEISSRYLLKKVQKIMSEKYGLKVNGNAENIRDAIMFEIEVRMDSLLEDILEEVESTSGFEEFFDEVNEI